VTVYLRRWHYDTYFLGEMHVDLPLETTETDVIALLDQQYYGGNWKRDSLRKGGKVKERKA